MKIENKYIADAVAAVFVLLVAGTGKFLLGLVGFDPNTAFLVAAVIGVSAFKPLLIKMSARYSSKVSTYQYCFIQWIAGGAAGLLVSFVSFFIAHALGLDESACEMIALIFGCIAIAPAQYVLGVRKLRLAE